MHPLLNPANKISINLTVRNMCVQEARGTTCRMDSTITMGQSVCLFHTRYTAVLCDNPSNELVPLIDSV